MDSKTMLLVFLASLFLILTQGDDGGASTSPAMMGCCKEKQVGGIRYQLVGVTDVGEKLNCLNNCAYTKEGSDQKYCFKSGLKEAQCIKDEGAPSTLTANTTTSNIQGVVISGGWNNGRDSTSVEFWSSVGSCSLPELPQAVHGHSIDFLDNTLITCGGYPLLQCYKLNGTQWQLLGQPRKDIRYRHSSTVIGNSLLLIGGQNAQKSTELVPSNGGEAVKGKKDIKEKRESHCAIKTGEYKVVLTGGSFASYKSVTEYSGFDSGNLFSKNLPSLNQGRITHACGMYEFDGNKILIVAGGFDGSFITTTETLNYDKGESWKETTPLPAWSQDIKGATLGGVFHVLGGWVYGAPLEGVLAWNPNNKTWTAAGAIRDGRYMPSITVINVKSVLPYCKP